MYIFPVFMSYWLIGEKKYDNLEKKKEKKREEVQYREKGKFSLYLRKKYFPIQMIEQQMS